MSARFAEGAARLAGLVPRLLGWTPAAFWQATPSELAAVLAGRHVYNAAHMPQEG